MTPPGKKIRIARGETIEITLSVPEVALIRNETEFDPEFGDLAERDGAKRKFMLSLDEVEALLAFLAAEIESIEDAELQQQLDAIYRKIEAIANGYEEEDAP